MPWCSFLCVYPAWNLLSLLNLSLYFSLYKNFSALFLQVFFLPSSSSLPGIPVTQGNIASVHFFSLLSLDALVWIISIALSQVHWSFLLQFHPRNFYMSFSEFFYNKYCIFQLCKFCLIFYFYRFYFSLQYVHIFLWILEHI